MIHTLRVVCSFIVLLFLAAGVPVPAPAAQSETALPLDERAFDHMSLGLIYEMQGNFPAAILEFQDALRYDDNTAVLYYNLFENFVRLQKRENAIEALMEYVRRVPDDDRANQYLIALLRESNRFADTEKVIEQLRKDTPRDLALRLQLLDVYLQQGDVKRAQKVFKDIVKSAKPETPPFGELLQAYAQNRQIAAGLKLLQSYKKSYKADLNYLYTLGQAYILAEDTTRAAGLFEQVYATDPQFNEIEPLLFDLFLAQQQFDRARAMLDRVEVPRRLELGRQYLLREQYDDAERLFEQLTTTRPRTWSKYFAIGRLYLDADQPETALVYLLEASMIDTTAAEQYYFLALANAGIDSLAAAEDYALHAIRREPTTKLYQNLLGTLYLDQDKMDDAIALWGAAVAEKTADARQYYLLGMAFSEADQHSDALAHMKTAMQMEPENTLFQNQLVRIFLGQQDFTTAIRILREFLLKEPEDLPKRYLLGVAYFQNQQYPEAIETLDIMLAKNSDDINALSLKGDALAAMDQFPRAEQAFLQVIAVNPNHALVLNNYSYLLAERGEKLEQALEMSQRAVQDQPENTSYLDTLGWIYYKLGRYEQALDYIRKAVDLEDDSAVILEHLGDVYQKMEDIEQARRYWQQALEQDPNNSALQDKLHRYTP